MFYYLKCNRKNQKELLKITSKFNNADKYSKRDSSISAFSGIFHWQ